MDRTTNTMSRDSTRNINIDFLKIVACLAVIGLHTLQKDISILNALLHYFCGFAIPVFFFATGFILLQRKEITFKYCFNKCLRIMRVVLIWNGGVTICAVGLKLILGKELDALSFIRDITYHPFVQKGHMWQFWYLGSMIILYLLLPLIHKAVYGDTKKWIRLWGILAIVCVSIQAMSMYLNFPVQQKVIQTFRAWTWIQYFLLGGAMFIYIYNKENYN